jgi:diaminopimelate decarboxylase
VGHAALRVQQGCDPERYQELADALSGVPLLIAYSVKANGNLEVLRTLAGLGGGRGHRIRGGAAPGARAGIPADRIVFSGVGKTVTELAAALDEGIYGFNVESEGELRALSDLAGGDREDRADLAAREPGRGYADAARLHPHRVTRRPSSGSRSRIHTGSTRSPASCRASRCVAWTCTSARRSSRWIRTDARSSRCWSWSKLRADGHELEYLDLGGGLGISYTGEEGISAR